MSDMQQGTAEWIAARLGKVTASRVADMMAKTKTGWGASRGNYMGELIAERLSGNQASAFTNAAMQWGTDMEPEARTAYEFHANAEVIEVGFVAHPTIAMSGASPDGLVGADGLVEIKCPNTSTHIETLLGGTVPSKYIMQVQWQLACTGRRWCDWVSYDPRMPGNMSLFVQRIHSDGNKIMELELEVARFLLEIDAKVAALREKYDAKAAA